MVYRRKSFKLYTLNHGDRTRQGRVFTAQTSPAGMALYRTKEGAQTFLVVFLVVSQK
jgi:hypothetical protein